MESGGQRWTAVDSGEQRWTAVDSGGQRWTAVDSGGQRWTAVAAAETLLRRKEAAIGAWASTVQIRYVPTSGRHE